MKLRKQTILELGRIINKEYGHTFSYEDLEKIALSLVGYFGLLQKISKKSRFGNSPAEAIDSNVIKDLDKEEEK